MGLADAKRASDAVQGGARWVVVVNSVDRAERLMLGTRGLGANAEIVGPDDQV